MFAEVVGRRLRVTAALSMATGLIACLTIAAVSADGALAHGFAHGHESSFAHIATFDVRLNGNEVAEIVDATKDGRTLIYTDSASGSIGFVDISDPAAPTPAGALALGGSPTSVAIGNKYALVAVDTSDDGDDESADDFDKPAGSLVVLDVASRQVVKTFPLGGQPDSIALSADGRYAAIVIENQRDEDENDGLLPQLPGGQLVVIEMTGQSSWWPLRFVDFTSLEMADAVDPEPEYVDINSRNQAVVTLQENNHIAIVDLRSGTIVNDFPAGEVSLTGVDATDDGALSPSETITRRREPDSAGWIDKDTFAVANEGDYADNGGSRSFTVFDTRGRVRYESGPSFEYDLMRAGHYNEGRSDAKGGEPEALEVGTFGGSRLLFVGSERANAVGVYELGRRAPELVQVLPTGVGPEGMKAIEKRDLLVVASETSVDEDAPVDQRVIPSMITIYRRGNGAPAYPQLASADAAPGVPIPWVAMSGLAGDPVEDDVLYAVSDSVLAEAAIHRIDVSDHPAVITDRVLVRAPDGTVRDDLDLEGIAVAHDGGFWVASEGDADELVNAVLRVDDDGTVTTEITLPPDLAAGATSSGFEGIAVTGDGTDEYVYVVIQRAWTSDLAGQVKIGRYDVAADEWEFAAYSLDPVESPLGGWVGLSEISLLPDGRFAIIERDNQLGSAARVKRVYTVDLATAPFTAFVDGTPLPVVAKTLSADLLDLLAANSVWTPDKLEGLGITADGSTYVVTDNDGLDDAVGQTLLLEVELD